VRGAASGIGHLENYIFQVTEELVGIVWDYYCNCRKLVSNPCDAETAAESWGVRRGPRRQPAPDGTFFLASSFRAGQTAAEPLGLPGEGHSAADTLCCGTERGQS